MPDHAVSGWKLDRVQRAQLLKRFPPAYPDPVADRVTLQSGVDPESAPPLPVQSRIVGQTDDGRGVQAMVVEIGGTTDRPDGSTYHITWSLDRNAGREAKESNDVLKAQGFAPLPEPVPVQLEPCLWKT